MPNRGTDTAHTQRMSQGNLEQIRKRSLRVVRGGPGTMVEKITFVGRPAREPPAAAFAQPILDARRGGPSHMSMGAWRRIWDSRDFWCVDLHFPSGPANPRKSAIRRVDHGSMQWFADGGLETTSCDLSMLRTSGVRLRDTSPNRRAWIGLRSAHLWTVRDSRMRWERCEI